MKSNPFSFLLDQLEQKLPDSLRPVQAEVKAAARSLLDDKLAQFDWCRAASLRHRHSSWRKPRRALPHWRRSWRTRAREFSVLRS